MDTITRLLGDGMALDDMQRAALHVLRCCQEVQDRRASATFGRQEQQVVDLLQDAGLVDGITVLSGDSHARLTPAGAAAIAALDHRLADRRQRREACRQQLLRWMDDDDEDRSGIDGFLNSPYGHWYDSDFARPEALNELMRMEEENIVAGTRVWPPNDLLRPRLRPDRRVTLDDRVRIDVSANIGTVNNVGTVNGPATFGGGAIQQQPSAESGHSSKRQWMVQIAVALIAAIAVVVAAIVAR